MDFFHAFRDGLFVHIQRRVEQLFRFLLKCQQFIPLFSFRGCGKLLTDFFIRDKRSPASLVIGEISQMDQAGEHVLLILKVYHIVLKRCHIHFHSRAGQHRHNRRLQSVKIHIDQRDDGFIASRLRPVALKTPSLHHADDRSGVVNMQAVQQIAIVPALHAVKIPAVFLTQPSHFFLRKSDIRSEGARIQHGELVKIIQSGLGFQLLNRKDPRQPGETNELFRLASLEHPSEKIDIFLLYRLIGRLIPDQDIPFVNNDDKLPSGFRVDAGHGSISGLFPFQRCLRACLFQLRKQMAVHIAHHSLRPSGIQHAPLYVKVDHVMPVQMLRKGCAPADLQPLKHFFRITCPAVVSRKHFSRDGFPETARTAVAD